MSETVSGADTHSGHAHALSGGGVSRRARTAVSVLVVLAIGAAAAVFVILMVRGGGASLIGDELGRQLVTDRATVETVTAAPGGGSATVTLHGRHIQVPLDQPWVVQDPLASGDRVLLGRVHANGGASTWYLVDRDRLIPLASVAFLVVVALALVAGWKGLRAAAGVGLAALIIGGYVLPSIAAGAPPVLVAVSASVIILAAVVYLAHGINPKSSAALLGTVTAMLFGLLVAWVATNLLHLTGIASAGDDAAHLGRIDLRGLMLAGFVIGSLGVLNDVTIAQASTVFELADHHTRLSAYRKAMAVGTDHIASATYTLVLAYTGSALPLLLILYSTDYTLGSAVSIEIVATEIARSLIGALSLILSVPLTTALAAVTSHGPQTPPSTPAPTTTTSSEHGSPRSGDGQESQ